MDQLTTLLMAAREGDARALVSFIRQTQPDVWRLCRYLLGPGDADDATQETYVAAWRALPAFRGDASAKTWLLSIARRTALREGRRRDRWAELIELTDTPAPAPDPQNSMEITALLGALDEDRRSAFVLTQLFGLTYEETAAVCSCPIGTIRSRVARARHQLVALWDQVGETLPRNEQASDGA